MSYLNSPRAACHRVMKICVQTILGLIRWKTTSIFFHMEIFFFKNGRHLNFEKIKDNLNFFKNERQPQYFQKWKMTSIVSKWKTTSKSKLIIGLAKLSKIFTYCVGRGQAEQHCELSTICLYSTLPSYESRCLCLFVCLCYSICSTYLSFTISPIS